VSGLSSFKNFKNQTTGCGGIAYSPVGYFILSHPVYIYMKIRNKNDMLRRNGNNV